MCGRFVSKSQPDEIAKYFGAQLGETLLEPSYNVAPTNDIYVVYESGEARRVEPMRWGLVPSWAKDISIGARMINARAEGIATKNAFRRSFQRKRCILPADGFYEWAAVPGQKRKQPMYIHRADGDRLAFAGLWEVWRNPDRPDDPPVRTCTIITGQANDAIEPVHDRMPVILPPDKWDTWLDPEVRDTELLGALLVPAPSSIIAMHPVSTDVNRVSNKGASLIEPVDPTTPDVPGAGQATLL
jgi:putative SOS response-associated peptidase YedK